MSDPAPPPPSAPATVGDVDRAAASERFATWLSTGLGLAALAVLALTGCDSCLPESWRVPASRKFEVMAIARHSACVQNNPCYFVSSCHRASEAFCVDAGFDRTCGDGEREGSCGVDVK